MLDCGTNSHEIISYVNKNKIDLIIIDHHKSNEKHSSEVIIINPNTILDDSGYNFLCTAGLVFVFLSYLDNNDIINLNQINNILWIRLNQLVCNITSRFIH